MHVIMFWKLLVFCATVTVATTIPSYLPEFRCRKSDPKYSACFSKSLKALIPHAVRGIKEWKVPPLDPLEIERFVTPKVNMGMFNVGGVIKKLKVIGIKDIKIVSVHADPVKLKGKVIIKLPVLHIESDFSVKGKIFGENVLLQGGFKGKFDHIKAVVKASASKFTGPDRVQHFAIDNFNVIVKPRHGHIKLTTKSKEQHGTAKLIEDFVNSDASGLVENLAPVVIRAIKKNVLKFVNNILSKVPTSVLLLE